MKKFSLVVLLLSFVFPACAQSLATRPETAIKWRQSVYQVLVWNSARIRANLEGNYNRDDVVKAATVIDALARSGLGSLYPAGSDKGRGWRDTTAKPELFTNKEQAGERAATFSREAAALLEVAGSGDAAAVKAQYGRLSQACKGCHDDFKVKEL
jgi:cytochrome c556